MMPDDWLHSGNAAQVKFYLAESYRALGQKEKACDWYAEARGAVSEPAFAEMSTLRYAELSYELERYQNAYEGYSALREMTRIETNLSAAETGMMIFPCTFFSSSTPQEPNRTKRSAPIATISSKPTTQAGAPTLDWKKAISVSL